MAIEIHKPNVAILISGRGSNMEALIKASKEPDYPANVTNLANELLSQDAGRAGKLIISDKDDAKGLVIAKRHNIKTIIILKEKYNSRIDYDQALSETLSKENIQYICAAGFMRILSEEFIDKW